MRHQLHCPCPVQGRAAPLSASPCAACSRTHHRTPPRVASSATVSRKSWSALPLDALVGPALWRSPRQRQASPSLRRRPAHYAPTPAAAADRQRKALDPWQPDSPHDIRTHASNPHPRRPQLSHHSHADDLRGQRSHWQARVRVPGLASTTTHRIEPHAAGQRATSQETASPPT